MADTKDNVNKGATAPDPRPTPGVPQMKNEGVKNEAAGMEQRPLSADAQTAAGRSAGFGGKTDEDESRRERALSLALSAKYTDGRPEYVLPLARDIAHFLKTGKIAKRFDDNAAETDANG